MNSKKLLEILIYLIAAAILGFGIFKLYENKKTKPKEEKQEIIKIGAILPLTGKYSDVGHWVKAGLILANDNINNQNKISYDILFEDSKSEASFAVSAYQKLTKLNKVQFVISATSGLSLALKPLSIKDSLTFFSIASHPDITSENPGNIFRHCNTSLEESKAISDYIKQKRNEKNIWIFFLNSEFGLSFKDQISADLKKIMGFTPYDEKPETFKNLVSQVLKKKPLEFIIIGFTPSLGSLIKTIREQGFKGNIISNIGFNSPSVIAAAGNAAKGVMYVDYKFTIDSTFSHRLDSISQKQFNVGFSDMSILAFNTMNIINWGINKIDNSVYVNKNFKQELLNKDIDLGYIKLHVSNNGNILPDLFINKY